MKPCPNCGYVKVQPRPVHLQKPDLSDWYPTEWLRAFQVTACGAVPSDYPSTSDPFATTCKSCKRTSRWQHAAGLAAMIQGLAGGG